MSLIIKSKSRKQPTFRQLFDYITRDKDVLPTLLFHNIFGQSHSEIIKKFEKNAQLLESRKGANYLYHEMLSLPELKNIPYEQQEIALLDIARKYLGQRAKNQLAIGAVHFDKDHIHLHLMVSANNAREKKRARLEKKEFLKIQRDIENYQVIKYPQLGTQLVYGDQARILRKALDDNLKDSEFQFNKRTGHKLEKQQIRDKVELVFLSANSERNLNDLLREEGLRLYNSRGAYGVLNNATGRKHRFKTLGLKDLFEKTLERINRITIKRKEIEQLRTMQQEKKQRDKELGRDEMDDFER